MRYEINHKNFAFECRGVDKFLFQNEGFTIRNVNLQDLHANLVTSIVGDKVSHEVVSLQETPHIQFIMGNKSPYRKYHEDFTWAVGAGNDHSEEQFDKLILEMQKSSYLAEDHRDEYIICRIRDGKLVIQDGLHRATILLSQGTPRIPVAIAGLAQNQLDAYLHDFENSFLEWYTPLQVGGHTIHERTYPNFEVRPEYLTNGERGESRWKHIVERNLPDVRGKRICDVGCNVGLYGYYMMKMGAASVDGFDRNEEIYQPSNVNLPHQNVVQQAYFVKNLFELQDGKKYDGLQFYEFDILKANFEEFKYDVFYSSCVLYHFGSLFEKFVQQISKNNNALVLQTNLGHGGELGQFASVDYHKYLLQKYGYNVRIDAPEGYKYPMIVGEK